MYLVVILKSCVLSRQNPPKMPEPASASPFHRMSGRYPIEMPGVALAEGNDTPTRACSLWPQVSNPGEVDDSSQPGVW